MIDGDIVQLHTNRNNGSDFVQGAAHGLPENSPSIDQHSKRTFDVDAELAEVKVKSIFVQG